MNAGGVFLARNLHCACAYALLLIAQVGALAHVQGPIKSGVDLIAVDVSVIDKDGNPLTDLTANDFEVWIDQRRRRVVSVQRELHSAGRNIARSSSAQDAAASTGPPARRFVMAVDEHSLQPATTQVAVRAGERFIDRLDASDLVGLFAYPTGVARADLTTDHASVRRALQDLAGLRAEPRSRFNLSISEIIDCAGGDVEAQRRVVLRECPSGSCSLGEIRQEALGLVGFLEMTVSQSLAGLRGLIRGLTAIPGRKILVLVSGGLISTDSAVGRSSSSGQVLDVAREAASANVDVFALHLDWSFQEALGSRGGLRTSFFRDSNMAATGLEMVAGASGGSVIRVYGTSPDRAFDRILRETSVNYILAVDVQDTERDGKTHAIRVAVKRKGAEIRSRTQVRIPIR